MITPRVRRTVATLAAVGALSLIPAAAHAETWSHTDPAGDVVQVTYPEDENSEPVETPAPDRLRGDVRRVNVAHNLRRIGIRFSMRSKLTDYSLFYQLRTSKGDWVLFRMRSGGYGDSIFISPSGRPVECAGLDWTIDWEAAKVAVSIPRRCLGNPNWVRVGLGVESDVEDAAYLDDGLRDELRDTLALSPRVHRG